MSTYNCANLLFNEKSSPAAFGITLVPYVTELLACQGILIHRIDEDRRWKDVTRCRGIPYPFFFPGSTGYCW